GVAPRNSRPFSQRTTFSRRWAEAPSACRRCAVALNVLSSPMLFLNRRVIIERAAELRLPSFYQWPEMPEEGGLLGYGPRFVHIFRQCARMVAKILSGAKPADLPLNG